MPRSPATLTFKGGEAMEKELDKLAKVFPGHVDKAIVIEAEIIMTRSKRDFVPINFGVLRSSGHVEDPKRRGDIVTIDMVYGGASAPYALAIHEHPSTHSPPSWRGTTVTFHPSGRGPKYLEKPFKQSINGMAGRVAKTVKTLAGI